MIGVPSRSKQWIGSIVSYLPFLDFGPRSIDGSGGWGLRIFQNNSTRRNREHACIDAVSLIFFYRFLLDRMRYAFLRARHTTPPGRSCALLLVAYYGSTKTTKPSWTLSLSLLGGRFGISDLVFDPNQCCSTSSSKYPSNADLVPTVGPMYT